MKQKELFELPPWIPVAEWNFFIEQRKKLRKTPTTHAQELLIRKLDGFRKKGHDVLSLIETATEHGWMTFYEPNGNGNGRKESNFERAIRATEEAARELAHRRGEV